MTALVIALWIVFALVHLTGLVVLCLYAWSRGANQEVRIRFRTWTHIPKVEVRHR